MQWNLFGGGDEASPPETPGPAVEEPAAPKPDPDSRRILKTIASGGTRFEEVVFTRNRRVMASVAGGGRVLRMNAAFREAPREVLHALGSLFSTRKAAARARARETIREYLSSVQPIAPAGPRRRRRERPHPLDEPIIAELLAEFRRVNQEYFDSSLPEVPIRLSGRMRRRNGHFSANPLEIAISRSLCTHAARGEALHTMRHEMIHLWQWCSRSPLGHGPEFRRWARRLDVHPRASRSVCWAIDRP